MAETSHMENIEGVIDDLFGIITEFSNLSVDDEIGFECVAVLKDESVRKLPFFENNNPNTGQQSEKEEICNEIKRKISENFPNNRDMYDSIEFCADGQNKIYALKQTEQYQPVNIHQYFNYNEHAGEAPECISESEFKDIKKILFRYHFNDKELVALQHVIFPVVYENSTKYIFLAFNRQSLHKISHPVLSINFKIDMLIMNDVILTRNIDLLQKYYGFEDLIRQKAENTINRIQELSIVSNNNKLCEYIERGKLIYMKKMMRISSSPVFNMSLTDLISSIKQNERWNTLLNIGQNNKIELNTFKDVEKLIDLFDERYTYSKISNTEYDTKVKRVVRNI